ncbi:kinase-like protein [Aspergillus carlsbadensis]|nr:kinase-like protein [Aspergillus carlsbadensis]
MRDRYRIVHKLGHGAFSTVWLARNRERASYVALKVSTANSPSEESDILRGVSRVSGVAYSAGRDMVPLTYDDFDIPSPNGSHKCYVTSPARCSVAAAKFASLFSIEAARALAGQLVLAVAYIHAQGVFHGDIHLRNVLLQLPSSLNRLSIKELYTQFGMPHTEPVMRLDTKPLSPGVPPYGTVPIWLGKKAKDLTPHEAHLILSDFGGAFSPSNLQQIRLGEQCQSPLPALPPEAHHQPDKPISFSTDIWTLACALWEIFSVRALFDATLATRDDIAAQQVDVLGSLPSEWWGSWQARGEYSDEDGRPIDGRFVFPPLEETFETDVQAARRKSNMGGFSAEEKETSLGMLRPMLVFRPDERATAADTLGSQWMRDWGLPSVEKMGNA